MLPCVAAHRLPIGFSTQSCRTDKAFPHEAVAPAEHVRVEKANSPKSPLKRLENSGLPHMLWWND